MPSENPRIPLPNFWPKHVPTALPMTPCRLLSSRRRMHVVGTPTVSTRECGCQSAKPKYIVCARDSIFDCGAFRHWVKRRGIKPPRYGAVGQHGSIAVVERLILTVKTELVSQIMVPIRRESFRRELHCFQDWYNEHRPHTTLDGRTLNEVYYQRRPAIQRPRIEPRKNWSRGSPCTKPWALVAGRPERHRIWSPSPRLRSTMTSYDAHFLKVSASSPPSMKSRTPSLPPSR